MTVYVAERVVTPTEVLAPGWVREEGGRIVALGSGRSGDSGGDATGSDTIDAGEWLLPGFVDQHCHGGGGRDFTDPEGGVDTAGNFHRSHGTTTVLASLVTGDIDEMVEQCGRLADRLEAGGGAAGPMRGIHLEGPYLHPDFRGAHDPTRLRNPTPDTVAALLEAGRGWVRMVTIAPELDGGAEAVRQFLDAGVVVAVGHTSAGYDEARAAFAAGASVLTHACNAMRPIHHRAPGPVVAALDSDGVTLEMILDGVHLHDAWSARLCQLAGDRTVCITDAMSATGLADGAYHLGPLAVTVTDGVARIDDGGAIAGSTLTMDRAFLRAVDRLGLDPVRAVRATATVSAERFGWAGERGSLTVGLAADLVGLRDGSVSLVVADGDVVEFPGAPVSR